MNIKATRTFGVLITFCVALSMGACASRASGVAPVAVASSEYSARTCEQLRSDLTAAQTRQTALERKQNDAALADAAGVFLFLVPLGSVVGANVEGDLAQAKGETIAIERSIQARCSS